MYIDLSLNIHLLDFIVQKQRVKSLLFFIDKHRYFAKIKKNYLHIIL